METFLPKGGRGQRAPYQTTTIRVPVPILDEIEQLIGQYRAMALGGEDIRKADNLDCEAAVIKAQEILADKKMNKVTTVKKLLEAIYGQQIKL